MGKRYQENSLFDIFYVVVDEGEDRGCQSPFESNLERTGNKMGILDGNTEQKRFSKIVFSNL